MRVRNERALVAAAMLLIAGGTFATFAILAWQHRRFTVDDAFITLRYSSNLARGDGPTWNPGEPPAEGYTTFAWMLLLTVPHLFGWNAIAAAKVAGVVSACGAIVATSALAGEIARPARARVRLAAATCAGVTLGASTSLAVHAISGMETALFTCLVTVYFALLLAWRRRAADGRTSRAPWVAALVGLAAGLTRPEGNLVVGVAFAVALVASPSSARRMLAKAAVAAWLVPYAAYFAWRWSYYGLLAPLSFYVKTANEPGTFRGVDELLGVVHLLVRVQPHLAIGIALALFFRARRSAPLLAAVVAFLAFFAIPAPIMAYERRYLFPLFPALFAVASAGLAVTLERVLVRRAAPHAVTPRWPFVVLVAGAAIMTARETAMHARASVIAWSAYGNGITRAHVVLADRLRQRGSGTIALVDVGAVAYVSGWRTIDTFGLNDPTIARSARHDVEYVVRRDPDVVVFLSRTRERLDPHLAWERPLHDAFVARGYVAFGSYEFAPDYFLYALAKPDALVAR